MLPSPGLRPPSPRCAGRGETAGVIALLPRCGEKVPEGRMRGGTETRDGLPKRLHQHVVHRVDLVPSSHLHLRLHRLFQSPRRTIEIESGIGVHRLRRVVAHHRNLHPSAALSRHRILSASVSPLASRTARVGHESRTVDPDRRRRRIRRLDVGSEFLFDRREARQRSDRGDDLSARLFQLGGAAQGVSQRLANRTRRHSVGEDRVG